MFPPVLARSVDYFPTVVIHRHLVVVVRAVWRGMVYDGGVVGCRRCGGGGAVTVWWFDGM